MMVLCAIKYNQSIWCLAGLIGCVCVMVLAVVHEDNLFFLGVNHYLGVRMACKVPICSLKYTTQLNKSLALFIKLLHLS